MKTSIRLNRPSSFMNKIAIPLALGALVAGCKFADSKASQLSAELSNSDKKHVEINSSIGVLGAWDFEMTDGESRCTKMAEKALGNGFANSVINFIPTHGFLLSAPTKEQQGIKAQQVDGTSDSTQLTFGDSICYRMGEHECLRPTAEMVKSFEDGMTQCFSKVFEKGAGISLIPHLDDGKREGRWRNVHVLDPVANNDWECKTNLDSYYCGLLKPLANAVKRARKSNNIVYFSAQGEMGATVFAYSSKYEKALDSLRKIMDPTGTDSAIRMGISVNFNKTTGFYPVSNISKSDFKSLLKTINFLGVSAYPGLSLGANGQVDPSQFNQSFDSLDYELSHLDASIKSAGSHLELHFSEVGVGGSTDNATPAKTTAETLQNSWAGIHGPVTAHGNPWNNSEAKRGAELFYCTLARYLGGQESHKWKVGRAFLWNLASWDIQGLYHASSTPKVGSYLIPSVADGIKTYNLGGKYSCPQ